MIRNTIENNIFVAFMIDMFLINCASTDRECVWSLEQIRKKKPIIEYERKKR